MGAYGRPIFLEPLAAPKKLRATPERPELRLELWWPQARSSRPDRLAPMSFHPRLPSIDKGVSAFLWALGFFLYIWLGQLAVGIGKGSAFILAAVAGGAIFLFIRLFGEGGPKRARR
jgi:hypothetical protein